MILGKSDNSFNNRNQRRLSLVKKINANCSYLLKYRMASFFRAKNIIFLVQRPAVYFIFPGFYYVVEASSKPIFRYLLRKQTNLTNTATTTIYVYGKICCQQGCYAYRKRCSITLLFTEFRAVSRIAENWDFGNCFLSTK